MAQYRFITIGNVFRRKDIESLQDDLNAVAAQGWKLDTVFSVTRKTCLLFSDYETNLMVLRHDGEPSSPAVGAEASAEEGATADQGSG